MLPLNIDICLTFQSPQMNFQKPHSFASSTTLTMHREHRYCYTQK